MLNGRIGRLIRIFRSFPIRYHSKFWDKSQLKLSFHFLKTEAKIPPDILCHTEKMAPGTVAMAKLGKDVIAKEVANPEFCIPISIDMAFFWAVFMCKMEAIPKPATYPNRLCRITTAKMTNPVSKIRSALCETTEAIIRAIATTDTITDSDLFISGSYGLSNYKKQFVNSSPFKMNNGSYADWNIKIEISGSGEDATANISIVK